MRSYWVYTALTSACLMSVLLVRVTINPVSAMTVSMSIRIWNRYLLVRFLPIELPGWEIQRISQSGGPPQRKVLAPGEIQPFDRPAQFQLRGSPVDRAIVVKACRLLQRESAL